MPAISKSDESTAGMPANNTSKTADDGTTSTALANHQDVQHSPTQFQANNDDTPDNQQTSNMATAIGDAFLDAGDYQPMMESRVITQTDRLNKQLLQSLLQRMQSSQSAQSSDDETDETAADWS